MSARTAVVLPEHFQKVHCRLTVVDGWVANSHAEEKGEEMEPFTINDGEVSLGDPQGVWYTGGREVTGLKCE